MAKGKNNTSSAKSKITTKNTTTNAKTTPVNMTGGAFSEDTSSTLLVILIILMAIVVAWLIYIHISKSKPIDHKISPHDHASAKSKENLSSVEEKVPIQIKVVTNNEVEDRAPIYPRHNPEYPLQRKPQGYQQVGVLVSKDSAEEKPIIMPLFGRKMYSRDRWEYYTASDEYHMWRIPVMVNNRDCQDDVGCDEIYNGDNVTVPDYANKVFAARIYKYRDPDIFSERY